MKVLEQSYVILWFELSYNTGFNRQHLEVACIVLVILVKNYWERAATKSLRWWISCIEAYLVDFSVESKRWCNKNTSGITTWNDWTCNSSVILSPFPWNRWSTYYTFLNCNPCDCPNHVMPNLINCFLFNDTIHCYVHIHLSGTFLFPSNSFR